jgi:cysteinyl-tRNA synthetase
MYTCGPSIYLLPHIGNYRTFMFEDMLQRYLEYSGYEVTRLLTLTDIEDKAIDEAKKENTVDQAVKLIKTLLEKGYAHWYEHDGRRNVYYDPLKFKEFGKLSNLDMSRWTKTKKRFHKDTYPGTPWNKGDFVLWHGYKEGDCVYWNIEIGKGRPAWNVQDAAMVTQCIGFEIDIACGGIDNLVRHHDYTIAIIEAVSNKQFGHYWLHGEHLFVDGKNVQEQRQRLLSQRPKEDELQHGTDTILSDL